jgi:ubiquinone/menaquinone biosynthesis C-methylase UbiE
MERMPEPELIDEKEAALAYDAADFSQPHEAFVDHFACLFPDFQTGLVLDLGCGTGDISTRFTKRYPKTTMIALDGAKAMLEIARLNITQCNLNDRIQLVHAHLPMTGLTLPLFDAVICNSLLHHLANPLILWQIIAENTKANAPFLVMDLLRPQTQGDARQLVQQYAFDAPKRLQEDFYASLLAAYTIDEVKTQLQGIPFATVHIQTVSDRHFVVWGYTF